MAVRLGTRALNRATLARQLAAPVLAGQPRRRRRGGPGARRLPLRRRPPPRPDLGVAAFGRV